MKSIKYISAASLFATMATLPAAAQFNQSIAVEGKYVPEIITIDRINTYPQQVKFSLETQPLAYDAQGVPASFNPTLLTMQATGWRANHNYSTNRGYLEIGAGSWLNSTLSAGYRFIDSEDATFGIRLQHNSTSLWKPALSEAFKDAKQWSYDEAIGLYGSKTFKGKGKLSAALDYHIGNFNYYGYGAKSWADLCSWAESPSFPTQTLNDISGRVSWHSESRPDDISWNVAAGARYFGYRSIYIPYSNTEINTINQSLNRYSPTRETDVNVTAGINFPTSTKSAIGIDLNADLLAYSGANGDSGEDVPEIIVAPDTYGLVTLSPYYRFAKNKLNIKIGLDIDIAARAGEEDNRYSAFHFAPNVTVDLDAGPAQLYLHLLGGSELHTLADGYELDYYQQPSFTATRPVYNPLDGSFGVNFGPFHGFSAGADFAFRISRGEYLEGWYQTLLNNYCWGAATGLPETYNGKTANYSYWGESTINMHGFSIGLHAAWDAGKYFKIEGKGNYQPQNGETGYFNGLDRPRWTADIAAETNPWRSLKLKLAYEYRGVRNTYIKGSYLNGKGFREEFLTSRRLPDLTYLNFGASYSFTDKLSLWGQVNNILNRHDEYLPGMPTQGITAALGVSILF